MFFPNNKIFVHIPKTGGSSLEYAITKKYLPKDFDSSNARKVERYAYDNFSLSGFFENKKKNSDKDAHTHRAILAYADYFNLDNFESFSIIRNPIEQAISLYNQQKQFKKNYPSLNDWFQDKHKHGLKNNTRWLNQYNFLYIGDEIKINKIFLYERYSEAQDYVEKAFDVKIDRNFRLWNTNYSNEELTQESIEYFEWTFAKTVELYNNLNF